MLEKAEILQSFFCLSISYMYTISIFRWVKVSDKMSVKVKQIKLAYFTDSYQIIQQAGAEPGQAQRLLNWAWIYINDWSLTA